jgi:hypothetical protein
MHRKSYKYRQRRKRRPIDRAKRRNLRKLARSLLTMAISDGYYGVGYAEAVHNEERRLHGFL